MDNPRQTHEQILQWLKHRDEFTVKQFRKWRNIKISSAQVELSNYSKDGIIHHVRKGVYAFTQEFSYTMVSSNKQWFALQEIKRYAPCFWTLEQEDSYIDFPDDLISVEQYMMYAKLARGA